MRRSTLLAKLDRPNRSVIRAVLALTTAEQGATTATLSLREASALLTHLRLAARLARWTGEAHDEPDAVDAVDPHAGSTPV